MKQRSTNVLDHDTPEWIHEELQKIPNLDTFQREDLEDMLSELYTECMKSEGYDEDLVRTWIERAVESLSGKVGLELRNELEAFMMALQNKITDVRTEGSSDDLPLKTRKFATRGYIEFLVEKGYAKKNMKMHKRRDAKRKGGVSGE